MPPHDEDALAQAIVRLLKDAPLRRELAAAAKQRVLEEFSVERMVEKTLGVYGKRLAARARGNDPG